MSAYCSNDVSELGKNKAQKRADALFNDHPQQPPDVVTGRAQHRMDSIADFTSQVTPTHSMVLLQVPDHWLNRLTPFELFKGYLIQSTPFAVMVDFDAWVLILNTSIAPVDIQCKSEIYGNLRDEYVAD